MIHSTGTNNFKKIIQKHVINVMLGDKLKGLTVFELEF